MYCLRPLKGYFRFNSKGYIDEQIRFHNPGLDYLPIDVDCGKCVGCKIKQRFQRLLLLNLDIYSNTKYDENSDLYIEPPQSLLTLTYNNENLPYHKGLNYCDLSRFLKTLKNYLRREGLDSKLRYHYTGEIGPHGTHRPHYHIYFTNYKPSDLSYLWKEARKYFMNKNYCRSEKLEHMWNKGFLTVIPGSIKTRQYCVGYTVKKLLLFEDEYLKSITKFTNNRKFIWQQQNKEFNRAVNKRLYDYYKKTGDRIEIDYELDEKNKYKARETLLLYRQDIFYEDDLRTHYDLMKKYIYVDGRRYLKPSFPCGQCVWDPKQKLNLPAEKMRFSAGIASSFEEIFKKDTIRGYVTDPFTKQKCKIPIRFMNHLKEEDFEKWETIKIMNSLHIKERDVEKIRLKKEEFIQKLNYKRDGGVNVKQRELDFSPLCEYEEQELDNAVCR